MIFTSVGIPITLANLFRGHTAFLICGGPSLATHDLSRLQERGVLLLAVNNAATIVRPQLWTCTDDPGNFADAIWRDPGIIKFAPLEHFDKPIYVRDAHEQLVPASTFVRDMPAVFGYQRNEDFVAERFLVEDTFNWGNHGSRVDAYGHRGSRSVMYVALKLLYHLGVRQVYLVGCDFQMTLGSQNYAFDQDRSRSSVNGNNHSYQVMNVRFAQLRPYFEEVGFKVANCTPNSSLTAFPHVPFEDAVNQVRGEFSQTILTAGMYDRQQRERQASRRRPDAKASTHATTATAQAKTQPVVRTVSEPIENLSFVPTPQSIVGYFDAAFVVNLNQRPDRLAHVTAECDRVRIPFERFEGIMVEDKGAFRRRGAHGCFLSHQAIWQTIMERRYARALILEDDVVFAADFADKLAQAVHELRKVDWDVFYGFANRRGRHGALRIVRKAHALHCYAVTRSACRVLLDHAPAQLAAGQPVDIFVNSLPLIKLTLPNNIAQQAAGWSDITERNGCRRKVDIGNTLFR